MERIETFLNSAAVEGVSSVRIIHGKGTGTLRRAVRDHLSDHPLVVLAAPDPGPSGEGATVVTLT